MKHPRTRKKIAMGVTAAVMAVLLLLPASLPAKEKRGAKLVVTRTDGMRIEGELIAVRPDSLLLLDWAGTDATVALADVQSIRIKRKGHAGTLALVGSIAGAAGGAYIGHLTRDSELEIPPAVGGLVLGAMGALAGLVASVPLGIDTAFSIAGEPDETVRERLEGLARLSRESRNLRYAGRAEAWSGESAADRSGIVPETKSVTKPAPAPPQPTEPLRPKRKAKFGIVAATSVITAGSFYGHRPVTSAFGLPGIIPTIDAGPHPMTIDQSYACHTNSRALVDSVSLVYDWGGRWTSDVEYLIAGPWSSLWRSGMFRFTSTADGKTYWSMFQTDQLATFHSLTAGLAYRPVAPTPFSRHVFEWGVAAGPAWVNVVDDRYTSPPSFPSLPSSRKIVLSLRTQISYDFYIYQAVSIGACVGYRHLEARFPATDVSARLEFRDEDLPYDQTPVTHPIEMTLPARTIKASFSFLSLRVGLRI